MTERVLVTGAGIISALGAGCKTNLEALREGRSGIQSVRYLKTIHTDLPVGEVKMTNQELAELLNVEYPESGLRTVLLGIFAAREALESANLSKENLREAAFINGTTVGGMDKTERHFGAVLKTDGDSPERKELQYNDCGCSSDLIARAIGDFAFVTTTSTACSSAANAIILGANLIKAGVTDIVIAGGSEALSVFHLNGFNTLMILDRERCRPFDRDRAGINLGEGAAYIVLESERSAKMRNAKAIAQLSGYGNACDAFHQTATSEDGEGAFRAMSDALRMAGLRPSQIEYINSHGTGTPNNDITEAKAMQRVWGDNIPDFSSTKAFTGHTTSASGSIESVLTLLALGEGFIPVNLGWSQPIERNVKPVVTTRSAEGLEHFLNNSFGFGGNDSSLIFSKTGEKWESVM